jgi:hypothetical protein
VTTQGLAKSLSPTHFLMLALSLYFMLQVYQWFISAARTGSRRLEKAERDAATEVPYENLVTRAGRFSETGSLRIARRRIGFVTTDEISSAALSTDAYYHERDERGARRMKGEGDEETQNKPPL